MLYAPALARVKQVRVRANRSRPAWIVGFGHATGAHHCGCGPRWLPATTSARNERSDHVRIEPWPDFPGTALALSTLVAADAAWTADGIRTERVRFAKRRDQRHGGGHDRRRPVGRLPARAAKGQAANISLATRNTATYFNILAPGETEVAFFNGSVNGNQFEGTLPATGDYRIRVYMMRSAARRNETANHRLEMIVSASHRLPPDTRRIRAGQLTRLPKRRIVMRHLPLLLVAVSLAALPGVPGRRSLERARDAVNDALDNRPAEKPRDAAEDATSAVRDAAADVKEAAADAKTDVKEAATAAKESLRGSGALKHRLPGRRSVDPATSGRRGARQPARRRASVGCRPTGPSRARSAGAWRSRCRPPAEAALRRRYAATAERQEAVDAVHRGGGQLVVALSPALVGAQHAQCARVLALGAGPRQHLGERRRIEEAEVHALPRQRVHHVAASPTSTKRRSHTAAPAGGAAGTPRARPRATACRARRRWQPSGVARNSAGSSARRCVASACGKDQTIEQVPSASGSKASVPAPRKRCQAVDLCGLPVAPPRPAPAARNPGPAPRVRRAGARSTARRRRRPPGAHDSRQPWSARRRPAHRIRGRRVRRSR